MNGVGAAVDHEGKTTHGRSMPHDPFLPCAHRESRRRALPKCSSPWNIRDWRPGASRHPCFLADLALSPAPAGSRQWLLPCGLAPQRALTHAELGVARIEDDAERPRFHCEILHREQHAPFAGLNRASNAVLECAILLTRLHMLPRDKIEREIAYLAIAIEKTAGPHEREAWSW